MTETARGTSKLRAPRAALLREGNIKYDDKETKSANPAIWLQG